jgi:hypothetical protein
LVLLRTRSFAKCLVTEQKLSVAVQGGRMWFDESPAQRVSCMRAQEALTTGARTLATACPFCLNMTTDGMAGTQGGEKAKVLDIAELLLSRRSACGPSSESNSQNLRNESAAIRRSLEFSANAARRAFRSRLKAPANTLAKTAPARI